MPLGAERVELEQKALVSEHLALPFLDVHSGCLTKGVTTNKSMNNLIAVAVPAAGINNAQELFHISQLENKRNEDFYKGQLGGL